MQTSHPEMDGYRQALAKDGFCVVENLLDRDTLDRLRTRFEEQADAERNLATGQNHANVARGNQWIGMMLNKGRIFIDLIDHPETSPLIAYVLGKDFTISAFDGHIQHPGSDAMGAHVDQWWMPVPGSADEQMRRASDVTRSLGDATMPANGNQPINPAVAASVMFMITDFTVENGATRVYPGSHLSGRQPIADWQDNDGWVPVVAPAGSALVFDGRLWHAAGANRTAMPRMGALAYYCAPFCRPLENYVIGLTDEARSQCPDAVLDRLGFRSWRMYGHTGDLSGNEVFGGDRLIGELKP